MTHARRPCLPPLISGVKAAASRGPERGLPRTFLGLGSPSCQLLPTKPVGVLKSLWKHQEMCSLAVMCPLLLEAAGM